MKMLTIREAAMVSGYSPRWLREMALTGAIQATKIGRDWLVSPAVAERVKRRRTNGRA